MAESVVTAQAVDPAISREKFRREVADFRRLAGDYRARGWFLAEAHFPRVVVVMAAPQLEPASVITGVEFDYTDYDVQPPSVRLVHPFTGVPYTLAQLPISLRRQARPELPAEVRAFFEQGGAQLAGEQNLMQGYGPDDIPFMCVAGVREYHDHPGHSGDPWELHSASGAGRLVRLLDVIDRYGIKPLAGFNIRLETRITGFTQREVPA